MKNNVLKTVAGLVLVVFMLANNPVNAQSAASQGAGTGAFIGALSGAIFGYGDPIGDMAEGALIGAGVGAIAGSVTDNNRMRAEQQHQDEMDKIIRKYGEDNVRGYIELVKNNHDKAIALFRVGQISSNREHQITAYWLEAAAEKDRRNPENASMLFDKLIQMDPDIDDREMASLQLNQIVLDLRNYRNSL